MLLLFNKGVRMICMLVKQDQYVEKSYIYVEFPYLCPNYNIYVQIAIYISRL